MRIALINGSPKINNSASSTLLADVREYLGEQAEVVNLGFHLPTVQKEIVEELTKMDAWVFAYPLYVDGIPGHLLSCLVQLEEAHIQNPQIHIYGIVNCGFYEGIQAELALKLLHNWCLKTGFTWSGGIGVGGGGGLAKMPKLEAGHGPRAPIENALAELSAVILKRETQDNRYVTVAFPRFLYKMAAEFGWRQMIKKNGGKTRDLRKILQ